MQLILSQPLQFRIVFVKVGDMRSWAFAQPRIPLHFLPQRLLLFHR